MASTSWSIQKGLLRIRTGEEVLLDEGDAIFLSCTQEVSIIRNAAGRLTCARVDEVQFKALVPDAAGLNGLVIRRGNEALRLLTTYLRDLDDKQSLLAKDVRQVVVAHIFNLLTLTLNSTRDAARASQFEGPSALRLRAIMQYVADHLIEQDISIGRVAKANHLSARQVQRLFEAEDTTFSEHLLLKRLQAVHQTLTDLRQIHRGISDIALANGFGDVSYFNRAFRNHYGASPTAIRRAAMGR